MGGWGFKENETDTFISVDGELSRGAINCRSLEGRQEGEGEGEREGNSLFPSASALAVKYLQTPNHKYQIKNESPPMSSAPAKWLSLIVSHQNRRNLGLDAFH